MNTHIKYPKVLNRLQVRFEHLLFTVQDLKDNVNLDKCDPVFLAHHNIHMTPDNSEQIVNDIRDEYFAIKYMSSLQSGATYTQPLEKPKAEVLSRAMNRYKAFIETIYQTTNAQKIQNTHRYAEYMACKHYTYIAEHHYDTWFDEKPNVLPTERLRTTLRTHICCL